VVEEPEETLESPVTERLIAVTGSFLEEEEKGLDPRLVLKSRSDATYSKVRGYEIHDCTMNFIPAMRSYTVPLISFSTSFIELSLQYSTKLLF
jgi:hypothetical protein